MVFTSIATYHISHQPIVNTGEKPQIRFITTGDGSHSLYHETLHETYHSTHGAMKESTHVFIEAGLRHLPENANPIHVLEIGFGTGLNAWLTAQDALTISRHVYYTTLEPFPLSDEISANLNYAENSLELQNLLRKIHASTWENDQVIHDHFVLHKSTAKLQEFSSDKKFDLIYYDAFGPPAQPEMWTTEILQKVADLMNDEGILVTYCAKGQVRRDLASAGLFVERLPGPPGKREMLRATKKRH